MNQIPTNNGFRGWRDVLFVLFSLLILFSIAHCQPVAASAPPLFQGGGREGVQLPTAAKQHRATLVRSAQLVWGLDAPIATFAAQVHQESRWRVDARSPVGAEGLAQFMPTTTEWIASAYPKYLVGPQPYNPGWAMRALVQYDKSLLKQNRAENVCEQWAMALSAYNGGQGWVNKDRRLALASGASGLAWFDEIENFNSGRSAANFKENRHYPHAILFKWEPLYVEAGWGNGVCPLQYKF